MANEFYYCVHFSIFHPTVDPKEITVRIAHLRPTSETKVGTDIVGKGGQRLTRPRVATFSHWSATLHSEERIYSGDRPLSAFLSEELAKLEGSRDLLMELRKKGDLVFVIGWFSVSKSSAGVLRSETLKQCGELGIDLQIDYYES